MAEEYEGLTVIGLLLMLLGFLLIVIPFISRFLPSYEKIPPLIWWTYRSDHFYFATSPILIIISIVSLMLFILGRSLR
jgi:hypothetical protein